MSTLTRRETHRSGSGQEEVTGRSSAKYDAKSTKRNFVWFCPKTAIEQQEIGTNGTKPKTESTQTIIDITMSLFVLVTRFAQVLMTAVFERGRTRGDVQGVKRWRVPLSHASLHAHLINSTVASLVNSEGFDCDVRTYTLNFPPSSLMLIKLLSDRTRK